MKKTAKLQYLQRNIKTLSSTPFRPTGLLLAVGIYFILHGQLTDVLATQHRFATDGKQSMLSLLCGGEGVRKSEKGSTEDIVSSTPVRSCCAKDKVSYVSAKHRGRRLSQVYEFSLRPSK